MSLNSGSSNVRGRPASLRCLRGRPFRSSSDATASPGRLRPGLGVMRILCTPWRALDRGGGALLEEGGRTDLVVDRLERFDDGRVELLARHMADLAESLVVGHALAVRAVRDHRVE